jgi:hypothetical protein
MFCAVEFQGLFIGYLPVVMKQIHVINDSLLFGEVFVITTRHNDKRCPSPIEGVQGWRIKVKGKVVPVLK